ncbi:MAG: DUF882 domain-containing protein [Dongiaceae bacterium]
MRADRSGASTSVASTAVVGGADEREGGTMEQSVPVRGTIGRRRFLGGFAAAAALAPISAWAGALGSATRRLSFVNLHTGENLTAAYWSNGAYERAAVEDINHLLRDFRTGEVHPIDLRLLDLLHVLQRGVESRSPFQVISGYRSPATNAKLAAAGGGVARRSYHMKGMAIDVALADRKLRTLRDAALSLAAGGVGYYPNPGFVHVDVGPVRSW